MALLARHGTREFWLVDPKAETIEVYTLSGNQLVHTGTASGSAPVRSPLLPGLSVTARF
jgi:Uma2 family endonuclease